MNKIRIGNGYDVHALKDGLELVIGGVKIPHSKGCVAHSDGDTLIHAICDAILGALSLGDIGKHFPDTSNEFKGIDSKILLSKTVELMCKNGYSIGNIDSTVALQSPKIAKYIPLMIQTLSDVIKTSPENISIKATTTEKLGFVGREEGIEAYSVVLLEKI